MYLLPSCDYFQIRYYHQLSQFCEPSPAHFPDRSLNSHASSHNSARAAEMLRGQTRRFVHVHSQRPRAERSSSCSQSKERKEQQMFRCWVQRNQDEVNRFPVFFQSQWKVREWKRECVSCPCVQGCKVGQRRNQPGLWGLGQGGPQGRWWSS